MEHLLHVHHWHAVQTASAEVQACDISNMLRFMQRIKIEWYDMSDWGIHLESVQGKPLWGVKLNWDLKMEQDWAKWRWGGRILGKASTKAPRREHEAQEDMEWDEANDVDSEQVEGAF